MTTEKNTLDEIFPKIMAAYMAARKEATVPVKTEFHQPFAPALRETTSPIDMKLVYHVLQDAYDDDVGLKEAAKDCLRQLVSKNMTGEQKDKLFNEVSANARKSFETCKYTTFSDLRSAQFNEYNSYMDVLSVFCEFEPDQALELAGVGPRGADLALKRSSELMKQALPKVTQEKPTPDGVEARTRRTSSRGRDSKPSPSGS